MLLRAPSFEPEVGENPAASPELDVASFLGAGAPGGGCCGEVRS